MAREQQPADVTSVTRQDMATAIDGAGVASDTPLRLADRIKALAPAAPVPPSPRDPTEAAVTALAPPSPADADLAIDAHLAMDAAAAAALPLAWSVVPLPWQMPPSAAENEPSAQSPDGPWTGNSAPTQPAADDVAVYPDPLPPPLPALAPSLLELDRSVRALMEEFAPPAGLPKALSPSGAAVSENDRALDPEPGAAPSNGRNTGGGDAIVTGHSGPGPSNKKGSGDDGRVPDPEATIAALLALASPAIPQLPTVMPPPPPPPVVSVRFSSDAEAAPPKRTREPGRLGHTIGLALAVALAFVVYLVLKR